MKVEFDISEEYLTEVLDWSASNAARLFDIGHRSGLRFVDENSSKLSFAPVMILLPPRGTGRDTTARWQHPPG